MRSRLTILLIILLITSLTLEGFTIEKVVILLGKVSKKLSGLKKENVKFEKQFTRFYNRYWKNFNRKFFKRELKLLKSKSVSKYYESGYIDYTKKDEIWKKIFKSPGKLWEYYPYVLKTDHYKTLEYYKKDPAFKKVMDKNIADMKSYAALLKKAVRLAANTRKIQKKRGKKIDEMKKQNYLFGRPKAYWEAKRVKLLVYGAKLEHMAEQQLTELILIINMMNELKVKGELLIRNMTGRVKKTAWRK